MEETNKSSVDSVEVKEEEKEDQPAKRVKTQETFDSEDRISSLTDCLIIDEILSRLDYTKEAITTGVLSKRWQHLWTFVPNLIFQNIGQNHFRSRSDFYQFVDKTLTQCRHRQLNKFKLSTTYDNRFESQVNNWIHFAIKCNVLQLYLNFWNIDGEHQFVLKDESFFINSHFTYLHLGACILNPTGPITWNNLNTLSISNAKLDQHLIANILSGSPLLDTLRLESCYGYSRLDITSKSVNNLEFSGYSAQEDEFDDLDDVIEINAPYISSLAIKGCLMLWKILLRDVSSLVKADLDYTKLGYHDTTRKEEREDMLKRFILNLCHVKELKIGNSCFKELSRLEAKGFIFSSNLKRPDVIPVLYSDSDSDSLGLGDSSDNDSSNNDNDSSDNDSSDSDASDSNSVESRDSEELVHDDGPEDDEVN